MKKLTLFLSILSLGLFAGCNKSTPESGHNDGKAAHAHDKDGGHSHGEGGHSHAKDDHHHDDDHTHEKIIAGPNGGRVITNVTPHLELLVLHDGKVTLTALDDELFPIPIAGQTASIIGGDRANPTRMSFAQKDAALVSDVALPEGDDIPIVLTITPSAGAKAINKKIQLNLRDCPECDSLEYACTCDHAH